jgi:predicted ArsR family transcriptional regulator
MSKKRAADKFDRDVGKIAALGEPVRRALYRYVVAQREPVGREQAAAATGVAHHVAKFHLDKLAADGLLDTEYSRPPGRSGPGAGRPAKRYRRAAREVTVSLPGRSYDLAGRVMAQAIVTSAASGEPVTEALHRAAAVEGRGLGDQARRRLGTDRTPTARVRAVSEVLAEHGYEPRTDDAVITLANCPFHALTDHHPELVCGMNLDLIQGVLDSCGPSGLQARLDPAPGRCCVTLGQLPSGDAGVPADPPACAVDRACSRGRSSAV